MEKYFIRYSIYACINYAGDQVLQVSSERTAVGGQPCSKVAGIQGLGRNLVHPCACAHHFRRVACMIRFVE